MAPAEPAETAVTMSDVSRSGLEQLSSGTWRYRGCTIEQRWLPKPGFRPFPDAFAWVHDDYDGAPMHSEGPSADHRAGYAPTLEDACEDIDFALDDEEDA